MKNDTDQLRVKPPPLPPDKQKMTFRVPVPTVDTFNLYLAAYAELYGADPDPDFVVNQILTAFFESDKAFAAYRRRTHAQLGEETAELGNSHI